MPVGDTLTEILVGGGDHHSVEAVAQDRGGGGDGVVGLVLEHPPHVDAHRLQGALGKRKLLQQLSFDPGFGFVPVEEVVPEGTDDGVCRHADVRHLVIAQQRKHRLHEADRRAHFAPLAIEALRGAEVRAEQLIRAID